MKYSIFLILIVFLSCKNSDNTINNTDSTLTDIIDKENTYNLKNINKQYSGEKYNNNPNFDSIFIIKLKKEYEYIFKQEKPFKNLTPFPYTIIPYDLNKNDYTTIENIIRFAIENYNKTQSYSELELNTKCPNEFHENPKLEDFQIELEVYYRQYIASIIDNKQYVFIQFFHKTFMQDHFKTTLQSTDGGGLYFFSFLINISEKKYYPIWVNAEI